MACRKSHFGDTWGSWRTPQNRSRENTQIGLRGHKARPGWGLGGRAGGRVSLWFPVRCTRLITDKVHFLKSADEPFSSCCRVTLPHLVTVWFGTGPPVAAAPSLPPSLPPSTSAWLSARLDHVAASWQRQQLVSLLPDTHTHHYQ